MIESVVLLAYVTLQRLGELALARRNTRALLRRGAWEHGAAHYPFIVALHAAWIAGLWTLAPGIEPRPAWLLAFMASQLARFWVLWTLGPRWTTRIIVLPGAPLVRDGPYRFVSHPNYCVVAAEIFVLPMVFGLWRFALIFSILNVMVIYTRVRAENAALRP